MQKSDFYYDLPEELIAQTPLEPRDSSRLMKIDRQSGEITHDHFYNLADYLREGDLLVMNDSKVFPARIIGTKRETGVICEFLLLKQLSATEWEAIVRPGRRLPPPGQAPPPAPAGPAATAPHSAAAAQRPGARRSALSSGWSRRSAPPGRRGP